MVGVSGGSALPALRASAPEPHRGLVLVMPVYGRRAQLTEAQKETFAAMDPWPAGLEEGVRVRDTSTRISTPSDREKALAWWTASERGERRGDEVISSPPGRALHLSRGSEIDNRPNPAHPRRRRHSPAEVSDLYAENIPGSVVAPASTADGRGADRRVLRSSRLRRSTGVRSLGR